MKGAVKKREGWYFLCRRKNKKNAKWEKWTGFFRSEYLAKRWKEEQAPFFENRGYEFLKKKVKR